MFQTHSGEGRREGSIILLVGDAMAMPLVEELNEHRGNVRYHQLVVIASGGAILSGSGRAELAVLLPDLMGARQLWRH